MHAVTQHIGAADAGESATMADPLPTLEDIREQEDFEDIEALLSEFDEESFSTVFTESGVPGFEFKTPFEICLRPYLEALGWEGEDWEIVEALPYKKPIEDLDSFRAVISRLGFATNVYRIRLDQIDIDHLPAIALLNTVPVILLSNDQIGKALLFDPEKFDFREVDLDETSVVCCIAELADRHAQALQLKKVSWFTSAMLNLKAPLRTVLGLTLAANLLALATPIYVMTVYDMVIGSKNAETLVFLFGAVMLIVSYEIFLKHKRGKLLAYVGARLSAGVMTAGFSHLLNLPVRMIEAAPIGTQVTRLKQFEGIHAIFTGPIASALLDLPFVLLFFVAIAVISPSLALVPVALAAVFAVVALIAVPGARKRNAEMSAAVAASNSFLTDAFSKRSSVQELRVERDWQRRFIRISRHLTLTRYRVQLYDSILGVVAQSMMMIAGAATLLIGASLAMAGSLSMGALIAIMMLIWRVLSPIQVIFTNLNRASQLAESAKQINVLMQIPTENEKAQVSTLHRRFAGRVSFANVSFRYSAQQEPVFRGLNLDVPVGQFVCVSGDSSGGKSTLLKLILGLYQPQAGAIFLDGLNLQQLNPAEVRASIAYVPLEPRLFHGTIAQNMRLGAPTATDEDIEQALADAGLVMPSPTFSAGAETRLTAEVLSTLPIGVLQRLSIARAYCRRSRIYLLNDPAANLDRAGAADLERQLAKLKGTATIILISNRASHQQICDRVIKISSGTITDDYMPADPQNHRPI